MFELTGWLDDMSSEVSVCVPTAAAPFFHWSLLTPIKVLLMTGLQQPSLIAQRFGFILLPREALKSMPPAIIRAGFHRNSIVLLD